MRYVENLLDFYFICHRHVFKKTQKNHPSCRNFTQISYTACSEKRHLIFSIVRKIPMNEECQFCDYLELGPIFILFCQIERFWIISKNGIILADVSDLITTIKLIGLYNIKGFVVAWFFVFVWSIKVNWDTFTEHFLGWVNKMVRKERSKFGFVSVRHITFWELHVNQKMFWNICLPNVQSLNTVHDIN